jgi:CBS domain-containing protein
MLSNVSDIMTNDPVCCTPNTELITAARMMFEHNCGEIPVIENQESKKPAGVVTDRDIVCRVIAQGKNPLKLQVKHCMTSPCVSVSYDTSIDDCINVMERHQIRRIPVVDEGGGICGIVAQADIARQMPIHKTAEVVKVVSEAA